MPVFWVPGKLATSPLDFPQVLNQAQPPAQVLPLKAETKFWKIKILRHTQTFCFDTAVMTQHNRRQSRRRSGDKTAHSESKLGVAYTVELEVT